MKAFLMTNAFFSYHLYDYNMPATLRTDSPNPKKEHIAPFLVLFQTTFQFMHLL